MNPTSGVFTNRYRQPLDEELREAFAEQEGLLYNMLTYQLGWVDEQGMAISGSAAQRVHPLLCLWSCDSLLGDFTPALPAAAAVELVHNFCLIHEDVQSGTPDRGQRPTVWWLWGPGQAINAGDGMHALARLALMRLQDRGVPPASVLDALLLLDRSCLTMCEGQHMDLAFQEKLDVGVGSYLEMAARKTGALMSCAMGLGALAARCDDTVVEAFKSCGKNLGIAWQIKRDIHDLTSNAPTEAPSGNVLNKKKLLPVVYVFETGDLHTKRELGTIYFKRILEPEDGRQVVKILNERSALEYAQDRVSEYGQRALECLEDVHLSAQLREELQALSEDIVTLSR